MGISMNPNTATARVLAAMKKDQERAWVVADLVPVTRVPLRNVVTACQELRAAGKITRLHGGQVMLPTAYPAMPGLTPPRPADPLERVQAFTL